MMKAPSKKTLCFILEVAVNAALLLAPIWITGVLHESDSVLVQIPPEDSRMVFVTTGFGLRFFSITDPEWQQAEWGEDIRFSDEQEDAIGDYHNAAHYVYHALMGVMWLTLFAPVILAVKRRWYDQQSWKKVQTKLVQTLAQCTIPLMIIWTLLMLIPFGLLFQSNLCGPHFVELGFDKDSNSTVSSSNTTVSSSDSSDDACGRGLEGTFAIVHSDVPSTCDWGWSGIPIFVLVLVWPFVMILQAGWLSNHSRKLQAELEDNEERAAKEMHVVILDDATVSSHDDAIQKITIPASVP